MLHHLRFTPSLGERSIEMNGLIGGSGKSVKVFVSVAKANHHRLRNRCHVTSSRIGLLSYKDDLRSLLSFDATEITGKRKETLCSLILCYV